MGKGSSSHKANSAAKRNRARYKLEGRRETNKIRKAVREDKKREKFLAKQARRKARMKAQREEA